MVVTWGSAGAVTQQWDGKGRSVLGSLHSQRIFPLCFAARPCAEDAGAVQRRVLGLLCQEEPAWHGGGGSHCGHLHRASLCPLLALGMGCHVWLRTMTPVSICARLVGHSCYGAVWGTAVPEEQCLAGDTGTQTTQGTLGHSSIMMVLGIPCSFQSWWSVPLFQGAVLAYGVSPGCYSL